MKYYHSAPTSRKSTVCGGLEIPSRESSTQVQFLPRLFTLHVVLAIDHDSNASTHFPKVKGSTRIGNRGTHASTISSGVISGALLPCHAALGFSELALTGQ